MSLFLVGNVNADTKTIEQIDADDFNVSPKKRGAYLVCIDDYKFIYTIMRNGNGNTATMTQFFEERDGKSLPAKC